MFWEKWIPQKYLIKSSVCGIEVLITDQGLQFHGVIVKNQGGKLTISAHFSSEQKLELPEEIKKEKIPLALCVTGKGIINKKINVPEDQNLSLGDILTQHLPTIQAEEFYAQLHPQENRQDFLSVIRKVQLDAILELFALNRYEVGGLLIGPAFISGVGPVTSNLNQVQTLSYTIELSNNSTDKLTEISRSGHHEGEFVNLDGLILKPAGLLGFGVAFIYFTGSFENYPLTAPLELYHSRHFQTNKTRVLGYVFISIAFLFCLINFFSFNYYFGASKKLEAELSIYQGKYEQINELLNSYEKQKGLIEQAGILTSSSISEFSDKIAATIPDEVVLTEWIFNPVKEQVEEDSLMNFKMNTIVIKGNCNKSLIINEWLNVLKSQNFIKDINLEKFSFNNEGSHPNFELKILTD